MCCEDVFGTTDREVVAVDEKIKRKEDSEDVCVYVFETFVRCASLMISLIFSLSHSLSLAIFSF